MKIEIRPSHQRGIALIIVMGVVLCLAVLAGGFAYSMKVEMRLARNANYDEELEWLGRSGVELARYVIAQQASIPGQGNYEALNQKWAGGSGGSAGASNNILSEIQLKDVPLGNGVFSVTITDTERKMNINWVCYPSNPQLPIMQQALNLVGISDATLASTIMDSICDWIDRDDDHRLSGAENDYYLHLPTPFYCKNGLIDDMSELLLIKGIWDKPEIYWGSHSTNHPFSAYQVRGDKGLRGPPPPEFPVGLRDLFTPVSGGKLNINTASRTTLQLIPGIDATTADYIIKARAGLDGTDGDDDDVPFQSVGQLNSANIAGFSFSPVQTAQLSKYCDVRSHTFEVQVDAEMGGYKRQYFALIRRGGQRGTDFQVFQFYWKTPEAKTNVPQPSGDEP